ncbi:MAG TPA: MFS transporter [Thermoanaerobaculia bacterium]|nr:MFS transporter [Thermoanaerobaculia bacterium]
MTSPAKPAKTAAKAGSTPAPAGESRGYSNYVLFVLLLVYVFNFIDRQILSILAEDIKRDLGLTDASIGFLYGTAFAVFYAIFGIPLGRLADIWVRKNLISVGLFFWSLMTALSGTARGFGTLAGYRIGVGVGESSASPAAFSMLGDYFPPRLRATAVAIYSSGVYIGAGIGIFIGGLIVDNWNRAFADGGAPFGLVGWQAAFFAVGIPGLLMSLWVWSLREPVRGSSEGLAETPAHPHPFRLLGHELAAVLPPLTFWTLAKAGAGARGILLNLAIAAGCALAAFGLITALGSAPQWIALAIGLYCFFTWLQGLALRDPATFGMIYRSKTVVFGMIGFAWVAFVGYGLGFWAPPFFQRVHGVSASEAGTVLGLTAAIAGWFGVSAGGVLSDRFRATHPKARLYMGLLCVSLSAPAAIYLVWTSSLIGAYVANFFFTLFSTLWIGSAIALVTELVLPRMRATASAFYILSVTFVGLALGPYTMGHISDRLVAAGRTSGEALRSGMLWGLTTYAIAFFFLWLSSRYVVAEEESRLDRARALGEPV